MQQTQHPTARSQLQTRLASVEAISVINRNLTTPIAPNSINEVGCIHTCQGLEVDYIGVIIGPDLIVRDGHVKTVPTGRDRFDKTLRGYKTRHKANPKSAAAEADLIIKNTYRTLMTRGKKGCYVYCSDEETAGYFRDRLSPGAPAAVVKP